MPGGGGGGGRPPKKKCPRCGRESDDQLSGCFAVLAMPSAIAVGVAALSLAGRTGIADLPPWVLAVPLAAFAAADLYLAFTVAYGLARRIGVAYRCPHCRFSWPPFLRAKELEVGLRDQMLGELFLRGFRAFAPLPGSGEAYHIEGEEGGRKVTLAERGGRVHLLVSVAHPERLDDPDREELVGRAKRLQEAIDAALPRPIIESLSVGDGKLCASLKTIPRDVADVETIVRLLAEAAPIFERVPIHVHGVERRAFTKAGVPRCAYCHGDVTGSEPDLVACERCSTVLHRGCWEELGRCPVLGCGGHERARAETR